MSRTNKKEALALCKRMIEVLGEGWKADVRQKHSKLKDDWFLAVVRRDEVCIMHYDPERTSYTAWRNGTNFELTGVEAKTPTAALRKYSSQQAKNIKWLKKQREELDKKIPLENKLHHKVKSWLK